MPKKIICTDGKSRTKSQIKKWLDNLRELSDLESEDLTEDEKKALEKGW